MPLDDTVALGVWGVAVNNVWVIGRNKDQAGIALHYDGFAWTSMPIPATGPLLALRGFNAGGITIWAVGKTAVLRYR